MLEILQPSGWAKPKGYSNGIACSGKQIYVGGQIGWNSEEQFEHKDFVGQSRQALENIIAVLAEADAKPEHVVRMTWYIVDKQEYLSSLKELGSAYREMMGKNFPVMSAVQVAGLMEDEARVEIEVTAVVPG